MRPAGTVTFLFGDIEGSTQRLAEIGPERYGKLLQKHATTVLRGKRSNRWSPKRRGKPDVDSISKARSTRRCRSNKLRLPLYRAVDDRQRCHVDNSPHGRGLRQDM